MLCYETTKFQNILFREAAVDESAGQAKGLEQYRQFVGDVFGRAYSGENVKRREGSEALAVYEKMHDAISDLPEWSGLAERTRNNSFLAGIAAAQVAEQMATVIPEGCNVGNAEKSEKLEDTLRDLLAGMDPESPEAADLAEAVESAERSKNAAVAGSLEAAEKLDGATMRNALRKAIQKALEEVDAVVGGYLAFGHDAMAPDSSRRSVMQSLAKRMKDQPVLAEIVKLAGRLQRMMDSLKTEEISKSPSEVVGVTVGDDIGRLLPAEMAKLASTPALFFKDLLERRLLQYQSRKSEPKGRGPVVVCVDFSGSMQSGSRWVWAAAIALALMTEAKSEGRGFSVCLFNAEVQQSWSFSDKIQMDNLMDLLCSTPTGGTRISSALEWAKGEVGIEKDADVIILSDGDDDMPASEIVSWNNWKKAQGCKTLAVRVAGDPLYSALPQISDRLWDVKEFADAARSLLAEVVKK